MVRMPGLCPHCHSDHVIKGGKTKTGKPRYTCAPPDCPRYALQLALTYTGRLPAIKEHIVDMRLNGSGMRDIARGWTEQPNHGDARVEKKPRR